VRAIRITAAIICCCLSGCLGYHIGPAKPYYLRDVHTIAVPTFQNHTLIPRIEVLVTDTVIKQLQQDGTFKIAADGEADATLEGDIVQITRAPARSVRGNVLKTTEFAMTMRLKYRLVARNGSDLVSSANTIGRTSFFVSSDPTTDERQALPLATQDLATRLTTQLTEGW
jgi:hypothetical protein